MVMIHAHSMPLASLHLTAENLLVAPTPIIEPEITWVVLTGMPAMLVKPNTKEPELSAQKPCTGLSFVSFIPIVFITRQPPAKVPSAMTVYEVIMTHHGTKNSSPKNPALKRSIAIIP